MRQGWSPPSAWLTSGPGCGAWREHGLWSEETFRIFRIAVGRFSGIARTSSQESFRRTGSASISSGRRL